MNQLRKMKKLASTAVFFLVLMQVQVFTAPNVMAQVTTGNLQGVVTDPNKAVIAGATVRITNMDTGRTVETTTNDEGFYRVTNLIPGDRYRIEITSSGFSKTLENVPVRLGIENSADIMADVAGTGEVVDISAGAQLIESTQSQLSTNYTPEQLTQLPYVGSIDNLALLTPGVVTPGDTDFAN
ncbi:MAG TPA: carboxypeptidase-like regulatory domain-containing protein, partial [Blastocatellia bacterium]|nr:carboxypeptidase-like regulatory domain-containing protein [Blastocatellia bacterium]